MKRFLMKMLRIVLWAVGLGASLLLGPRLITGLAATGSVYAVEDAPGAAVAIVFGAGLQRNGGASAVLRDRIRTAVALYEAGKVDVLLMSGDNSSEYYDEPTAMFEYARALGVPEEAIVLDYAGRRTYDTCYRAREIFGVTKALLVTQEYHLPRALYVCNALGVSANGVIAEESRYWRGALTLWSLRELPATLAALWEVHITRPLPILGQPEPIIIPEIE